MTPGDDVYIPLGGVMIFIPGKDSNKTAGRRCAGEPGESFLWEFLDVEESPVEDMKGR